MVRSFPSHPISYPISHLISRLPIRLFVCSGRGRHFSSHFPQHFTLFPCPVPCFPSSSSWLLLLGCCNTTILQQFFFPHFACQIICCSCSAISFYIHFFSLYFLCHFVECELGSALASFLKHFPQFRAHFGTCFLAICGERQSQTVCFLNPHLSESPILRFPASQVPCQSVGVSLCVFYAVCCSN